MRKILLTLACLIASIWGSHASACSIVFNTTVQSSQTLINFGIVPLDKKPCTAKDFNQIYATLSNKTEKDFFRYSVQKYYETKIEGFKAQLAIPVNVERPSVYTYDTFIVSDKGNGNANPGEPVNVAQEEKKFQENFNTKFLPERSYGSVELDLSLSPPPAMNSQGFFSDKGVYDAINGGYAVIQIAGTVGQSLAQFWDMAVMGKRLPDYVAAQDRLNKINSLLDQTRALNRLAGEYLENARLANDQISMSTSMSLNLLSGTADEVKNQLSNIQNKLKAQNQTLDQASRNVSQLVANELAGLNLSQKEIDELRKGKLSTAELDDMRQKINKELADFNKTGNLQELGAQIRNMGRTRNPLVKAQLQNLLAEYVDSQGVVKGWEQAAALGHHQFTQQDVALKNLIVDKYNQALGLVIQGNDVSKERAAEAMRLAANADRLIGPNKSTPESKAGYRFLNSATALLAYESGQPERLPAVSASAAAQTAFGLPQRPARYEEYVAIQLGNELAPFASNLDTADMTEKQIGDATLAIAAMSSVRNSDSKGIQAFHAAVETAVSVAEFLKGRATGIVLSVVDTVTSTLHFIKHPIKTTQDIVSAAKFIITNSDQAKEMIVRKLEEFRDEWPNMSPEQKGEIVGRITGEIFQSVVGGAVVKGASNLLKGSKLFGEVAQVVSKVPVPKSFPGGKTFEGLLYRGVPRKFVNSGWSIPESNILSSHRYSGVGQEALYSSTSTKGVLGELKHYFEPEKLGGIEVISRNVKVDNILDLTDDAIRKDLGLTLGDLVSDDYFTTQAVGKFTRYKYNGLLVPSAREAGTSHLVLFRGWEQDVAGKLPGAVASLGKESIDDFWRLGRGYGSVTASTENMILRGAIDETGALIGARSPSILADASYDVSKVLTNFPDGSSVVSLRKKLPDGTWSEAIETAIFPRGWNDLKISSSVRYVSEAPAIARRPDGATFHLEKIDGVEIGVIKNGDTVLDGFPTGGTGRIPAGFVRKP